MILLWVIYVRNGIPAKRLKAPEPSNIEVFCVEVTFSKRKWLIYPFYRLESFTDLATVLKELKISVDKAISKYENILLMGDINLDMSDHSNTHIYEDVCEFCDIVSLTKQPTCLTPTATHSSLIDVMLTSRPRSIQNSVAVETGLSDDHKIVIIIFLLTGLRICTGEYKAQGPTLSPTEGNNVLKCHFIRLTPIHIQYQNYIKHSTQKPLRKI